MKTLLKQVLITPGTYPRICARIVPQDQCEAIRPGIRISHYAFTNTHGQHGYIVINHTTQRAGICFAQGRTEWGRWNEEAGTIITDGGRLYSGVPRIQLIANRITDRKESECTRL